MTLLLNNKHNYYHSTPDAVCVGCFTWGCHGFDSYASEQTTQVCFHLRGNLKITDNTVISFHPVLAALTSKVAA